MSEYIRSGPVSLYLHFPFCERKCRYCDFLSGPAGEETRVEYINLLCREIALRAEEVPGRVDTVFIGGGTPSLMTPAQAERVMETIRRSFTVMDSAEISMEVNPGTADLGKLLAFRAAGINRLSIGVQSFDDDELKLLGRIHNSGQAREIFLLARKAGFTNINLDLMSALPGQKIASWSKTLREAVTLGPEHISAYSLIIEDGTPFATMPLPNLPSEEEDRDMYHLTKQFLAENGYSRYEISNYARAGHECRHNCGYWTGHQYLGLGLGASSDLDNERFHNPNEITLYRSLIEKQDMAAMRRESRKMTRDDRMEEFMFLGLRMTDGVSEREFEQRFGTKLEDQYGDILRKHLAQNLIRRIAKDGGRIALTEYGMDVANYVMSDYLL